MVKANSNQHIATLQYFTNKQNSRVSVVILLGNYYTPWSQQVHVVTARPVLSCKETQGHQVVHHLSLITNSKAGRVQLNHSASL